jgi:uncharacterized protein (TIGR02217 family)
MSIAAFVEERFNTDFRYGLVGGPEFNTTIIKVHSGVEEINVNWTEGLGKWTMGQESYSKNEIDYLISFFNARLGRAVGFRFKAWEDFQCKVSQGVVKDVGNGPQLFKRYTTPGGTYVDKMIQKPVLTGYTEIPFIVYQSNGTTPATGVGVDPTTGYLTGASTTMVWKGEFDRPARFDTDSFQCEFMAFRESDGERLFQISNLTIREIRV